MAKHRRNDDKVRFQGGLSSLSEAFAMSKARDQVRAHERRVGELEQRIDELNKILGDAVLELRDGRNIWLNEVPSDVRFAMISSLVIGSEEYIEADIVPALTHRGKQILFKRATELRDQSREQMRAMEELKVLEEKEQNQGQVEIAPQPVLAIEAAQTVSKQKDAVRTREREQVVMEPVEGVALNAKTLEPEAGPQEKNLAEALSSVQAVIEEAESKDRARAEALATASDAPPKPPDDEVIEAAAEARVRDEARARDRVAQAQRIALEVAADAPPVPPPDVEVAAEAPSQIERIKELLLGVEASLKLDTRQEEMRAYSEDVLAEIMALIVAEERRAMDLFEAGKITKIEKEQLKMRASDARRQRRNLHTRLRAAFREGQPGHDEPAVIPGVADKAEVWDAEEEDISARIGEVQAAIIKGHTMLSMKGAEEGDPEVIDVRGLQELMGKVETKLSVIARDVETRKESGSDVAMLDARRMANLKGLRRLQSIAERAIGELTQAELSSRFEPEDFSKTPDSVRSDAEPEIEDSNETPDFGPLEAEVEWIEDEDDERSLISGGINPSSEAETVVSAAPQAPEEPSGFFARARHSISHTLSYLRNGWREVGEKQLRKAVERETGPRVMTKTQYVGNSLLGVANVALNAGLSYSGAAVIPDAARYFSQKSYTKAEQREVSANMHEALAWQERKSQIVSEYGGDEEIFNAELAKRKETLTKKIDSLPYNDKRKLALKAELEGIFGQYDQDADKLRAQQAKEVAKVLEAYITTNIDGAKVAKEAVNSTLVAGSYIASGPVALAGIAFARGAAYSLGSLNERYRNSQAQAARGERAEARLAETVKDGFKQWWAGITFNGTESAAKKSLSFMKATGQLGRALGMTAAMTEGSGMLDALLERYQEAFPDVEIPRVIEAPVETPVETPVDIDEPQETLPPVDTSPVFRGVIPEGSRVLGGSTTEGITYILKRVIKSHPEAYGYDGDMDVSAELFAKRMAMQVAENDGQMRRWLTDAAVDRLNLFPELVDGKWHIAAVVDGKRLSMTELAEQGFTSAAPAASK